MNLPKKRWLIILLVLLLVLLGLLFVWLFLLKNTTNAPTVAEKVASPAAKKATSSATPSPPTVSDEDSIKKALVEKTQIPADQINVTVSQNDGKYAKGFVGTKGEETGGGYFLAVKVGGVWIIVYDGQATPDCVPINSYAFPVSMVPECLDTAGNLMQR